jgi:hypothetical protein
MQTPTTIADAQRDDGTITSADLISAYEKRQSNRKDYRHRG